VRKIFQLYRGCFSREDIEREARAISNLCNGAHANLVTIYRHGWINKTYYYIDMELFDKNLDCYIIGDPGDPVVRCPKHPRYLFDERFPVWWRTTENMRVMLQIASGVAFIHKNNYIHRDLKPKNSIMPPFDFLLTPLVLHSQISGIWKISDVEFTTDINPYSDRGISSKYSWGSGAYRAPELVVGDDEEHYSSKSDIWALGCILFEMFMRRRAFSCDGEVVQVKRFGVVHKQIRRIAIPEVNGCDDCTNDLGNFKKQMPLLNEINERLKAMMSVEEKDRPSARDLLESWKKWDERLTD